MKTLQTVSLTRVSEPDKCEDHHRRERQPSHHCGEHLQRYGGVVVHGRFVYFLCSGVLGCDLNARLEQQSLVVMMIMMFIEGRQKAHMEDI